MQIEILSNKRGIISLYDENKYIIYSQFYGVVAESTKIERIGDDKVEIVFDICRWYGYWDVKPIITRGIKKQETMYIQKDVTIKYNIIDTKTENSLDKYLKFELLERW